MSAIDDGQPPTSMAVSGALEPGPEPEPESAASRPQQVPRGPSRSGAFFSAYAPPRLQPNGDIFLVEVAAYTKAFMAEVTQAVQSGSVSKGKKGPLKLRHGAAVVVALALPAEVFDTDELAPDEFLWEGEYGIAQFMARCRRAAPLGEHVCTAAITVDGRRTASLRFKLSVVARELASPPVSPPNERVELAAELALDPPEGLPPRDSYRGLSNTDDFAQVYAANVVHIISAPYYKANPVSGEKAAATKLFHDHAEAGVYTFNPNSGLRAAAEAQQMSEAEQGRQWLKLWTEVMQRVKTTGGKCFVMAKGTPENHELEGGAQKGEVNVAKFALDPEERGHAGVAGWVCPQIQYVCY